jgi:hypothetical protein
MSTAFVLSIAGSHPDVAEYNYIVPSRDAHVNCGNLNSEIPDLAMIGQLFGRSALSSSMKTLPNASFQTLSTMDSNRQDRLW